MATPINDSGIKKLKLLYTVVDRTKAEFYLDVLSQFEVNFQTVAGAKGTAKSEIIDMLGLNINKVVIMSVVREDRVNEIMNTLEKKFKTIKNGKGIAFAVPFSSIIGANTYQFFINNKQSREN